MLSERFRFGHVEPVSVIAHEETQGSAGAAQFHRHRSGVSMPDDISDRFLRETEAGDLNMRRDVTGERISGELRFQAGPFGLLVHVPTQGWD